MLLVRSRTAVATTWDDVRPWLHQYAVIYPAMARRLDLSSYEAVSRGADEIRETTALPIEDPAHMPVTRDLSASRLAILQAWIRNGCPRGDSDA